jgi:hypothetical protein
MGINRRYAYDTQADIDHEQLDLGNVPGGKVGVTGDPNKVLAPLPFFTPQPGDYTIIDLYKGMIEMSSGISDFYAKGIGTPSGNRTSSGISQVINESGFVFKRFISNLEIRILQPLCEMVASMIQQFGTDEMEWDITNAPPNIPKYGRVRLEALIGNYSFDFVGANYATGKVVKQRNLMAFYNIAMQSPYANQGEFLREIARCMEIPYANRLLKSEQEVQQAQQAATQSRQQEEFIKELLKIEQKVLPAAIAKKDPNTVTADAKKTMDVIDQYLAESAAATLGEVPADAGVLPGLNRHEGGQATSQFEGEIPGGDIRDHMRGFAQDMSANSLGTAGSGE